MGSGCNGFDNRADRGDSSRGDGDIRELGDGSSGTDFRSSIGGQQPKVQRNPTYDRPYVRAVAKNTPAATAVVAAAESHLRWALCFCEYMQFVVGSSE